MRRQEGSEGWRVAQERDVMSGCAGEVIGDRDVRFVGRIWRPGNIMGEMKGLQTC